MNIRKYSKSILKENIKMMAIYFYRCRLIFALNLLFSIVTLVFMALVLNSGLSDFQNLRTICRYQFYLQVFILVSSYEFMSRVKDNNLNETLESLSGGRPIYSAHFLIWQLMVIGLIQLFVLLAILYGSVRNGFSTYFLAYLWKPFLINALLPSIICVLLAYVLANRASRLTAYGFILLFLVMISPFAEIFIWEQKPAGLPIDQIYNFFRWPFTILYQNADWQADVQYGLQTEIPRWQVQLSWIILLFGLSPISDIVRRKGHRKQVPFIAMILAGVVFILSFQPASLLRINKIWDGYYIDFTYFDLFQGKNILDQQDLASPDFKVIQYSLNVDLNRAMAISMAMDLQSDQPRTEFDFTLYRGYRVTDACLDSGEKISFQQIEDRLIFSFPEPQMTAKISLKYVGHSNKLYSNSEGAMLPGFFPWYPMAGERKVFLEYPNQGGGYGYNPYNRTAPAKFEMTVTGVRKIVTNLSPSSDGGYIGIANGLSLFAGQILPTKDSLVKTCLPLTFYNSYTVDDFISEIRSSFKQTLATLENTYGQDVSDLYNKPIICPSSDLSRNYTNNGFAVFNDHILVSTGSVQTGMVLKYYLSLGKRDSVLGHVFALAVSNAEDPSETVERMFYFINMINSKEVIALKEPMQKAIDKAGSRMVVREIYQYCKDSKSLTDDQKFLDWLIKGA